MVPVSEVSATSRPPKALRERMVVAENLLERLRMCNLLREVADYSTPVTVQDLSRIPAVFLRLIRRAYDATQRAVTPSRQGSLLQMVGDAGWLVMVHLLLCRGRVWRIVRSAGGAILRNAVFRATRYRALPAAAITGYVRTSEREEPLIRVCLLLRLMRRYDACISLLLQRWRSGLPVDETQRWLAFFLREIGETDAATRLADNLQMDGAIEPVPCPAASEPLGSAMTGRRLKYGIVMPVMFDSPVFRRSLLSLLESDFEGDVVVVEDGYRPERACAAFCEGLPVTYVKNPRWTGPSGTVNLGMERLEPETQIAIYAHSDVLWPRRWFSQLDSAWEKVFDSGKIGIMNLGYLEFHPTTDAVLSELFVRGRYEQLVWLLRAARDLPPPLAGFVQEAQVKDPGRLFGLARDTWCDRPSQARLMTGRFSVGASFLVQTWRELGGFDAEMAYGMDMELQYRGFTNRQWTVWINNSPLIHLVSTDTIRLSAQEKPAFYRMNRETYERFAKKYGWEIDHFYFTFFAETCMIYHDDIINAINESRFEDINFVFEDLAVRLRRTRLSSCELMGCSTRPRCPYV